MRDELIEVATKKGLPAQLVETFLDEYAPLIPSYLPLTLKNENRKWEMVSAIQKGIRRGETVKALRLASALTKHPSHDVYSYLWRRLVVTAMEDVGIPNKELMAIVFLCCDVFSKKSMMAEGADVALWLTEALSTAAVKDRSICDLGVIDYVLKEMGDRAYEEATWEGMDEERMVVMQKVLDKEPAHAMDAIDTYLAADAWKTQEMNLVYPLVWDFAGDPQDWTALSDDYVVPEVRVIAGLDSYAYDMHTRSGQEAIRVFSNKPVVKAQFSDMPNVDRTKVLRWILFYVEAELLDCRLEYPNRQLLYDTSVEVAMRWMGVPMDRVQVLQEFMVEKMPLMNDCREYATREYR